MRFARRLRPLLLTVVALLAMLSTPSAAYDLEHVWTVGEELSAPGITLPVVAQKTSNRTIWMLDRTTGRAQPVTIGREPVSWQECTSKGDNPELVQDIFIARSGSIAIVHPCQLMVRCSQSFSYLLDLDDKHRPMMDSALRVPRFEHVLGYSKIGAFIENGRTHPTRDPETLQLDVIERGARSSTLWSDSTFTTLISASMNDRDEIVAIIANGLHGSNGFGLLRALAGPPPSFVPLPALHSSATVALSPTGTWLAIATSDVLPGQELQKNCPMARTIEVRVLDPLSLEQHGPVVTFAKYLRETSIEWLLDFAVGDDGAVAVAASTLVHERVLLLVASRAEGCGKAILPAESGFRSLDVRVFGDYFVYVADSYEGGTPPRVFRYR
jgi:hypothetical protein